MTRDELLELLSKHGALVTGTHVVYTSGRHGDTYVNKDAIYPHIDAIRQVCGGFAERFRGASVDVVAGPAIGGVVLSQWTAHHLSTPEKPVLSVYAEKTEDGGLRFRRGYDRLLTGRRVLVVEDILTTGGSLAKVIAAVRECGGEVVGAAALCNRGGIREEQIGNPPVLHALLELSLNSWEAGECPLCASGVPINPNLGKGK